MQLNKYVHKTVSDLSNDDTKHCIGQNNFNIAVGFQHFFGFATNASILDETFFRVSPYILHTSWENGVFTDRREYLDYGYCNKSDFPQITQRDYVRLGLYSYMWIK